MFEAVELGQLLKKSEFKAKEAKFRGELLNLQLELKRSNIATLIIVAGVEGAGKGDVVNRFNKWFDGRGMETHAFWDETDEENQRAHNWRFWKRLPVRGSIAVMFGGWYWNPVHDAADGKINEIQLDEAAQRINALERTLSLDGMLVIKMWFHLSKHTFEKRMKKRREVSKHIRHANSGKTKKRYAKFLPSAERIIRQTDTGICPWKLIEADDKWFRDYSVARHMAACMKHKLMQQTTVVSTIPDSVETETPDSFLTILDKVDLTVNLSRKDYTEQLNHYQTKLEQLVWKAYDAKRSTIIVFEGWDAAGKGGTIRRMTDAMDARLYRVMSVAAPTDEERAHHYLWRFWRQVPRDGYMRIYDRSWYGRVLVERVEKFAQPDEWKRAYEEINNFEEQLVEHGMVVIKFWLHISQEEQLRRFHERTQTVWKQHKITDEDWRNREKWDDYKHAVNAMINHTSTGIVPWVLIPTNDKLYARIEVIKNVCRQLEYALKK